MSQYVPSNQVVSKKSWLLACLTILLCCGTNWDWQALPLLKASHFRVVCALGACPSLTKLELMLHVPVSWRLIYIWSMLLYTHTKVHCPMHPCTNAYMHTYVSAQNASQTHITLITLSQTHITLITVSCACSRVACRLSPPMVRSLYLTPHCNP